MSENILTALMFFLAMVSIFVVLALDRTVKKKDKSLLRYHKALKLLTFVAKDQERIITDLEKQNNHLRDEQ